jgi:hypothetical protein
MIGDDHAVSQPAFAQRSFEIGNTLVAVFGIVFTGTHGGCGFARTRLILSDAKIGDLRLAIDHGRDHAFRSILRKFQAFSDSQKQTSGAKALYCKSLTRP